MKDVLFSHLCTPIPNEASIVIPIGKPEEVKHQLHSPAVCLCLGSLCGLHSHCPPLSMQYALDVSSSQAPSRMQRLGKYLMRFALVTNISFHSPPPPCPHRVLKPPVFIFVFCFGSKSIKTSQHCYQPGVVE